jgi:hypothetical protein
MLNTYNLMGTIFFPTRTVNNSATLIDNILIGSRRSYTIKLSINGLSDHDPQLITINNVTVPRSPPEITHVRNINKKTIAEFQLLLNWEYWDDVMENNSVSSMFNNFLNTYLRCFCASFPKKESRHNNNHSKWITQGIRISCKRK